jgi:uncharacterized protein YceH (UPF0502 family)
MPLAFVIRLCQFIESSGICPAVLCNFRVIFDVERRDCVVYGNLVHMHLNQTQLRVLGALIEKEITTPENYPLSLNALINACNQRSSRDPVLDLDEEQVRQGLHVLEEQGLVSPNRDARVTKYEHRIRTVLNLRRDETALLCLLLLRGPQTPGELRSRADRMYAFDDLGAVTAALDRLAARPEPAGDPAASPDASSTGPLVALLPRQPGAREARYAHLLGGPVTAGAAIGPVSGRPPDPLPTRPAADGELQALRERVNQLVDSIELMETRIAHLENQRSG